MWRDQSIRSLADVEYGKSPNDVRDPDALIPIIGTSGVQGAACKALFDDEAIVVGRKGTLDNPVYIDGPFWVIDTAYAVLPKSGVNAKWLYYHLDQFDLSKLNEATGVPSISRDYLYRVEFPTPGEPVQTEIAEVLTCVDATIEKTEALIAKYEQIKKGMMQDLFTRGLDEAGRLRPPPEDAPDLYHETELGLLPTEWEVDYITKCTSQNSDSVIGPFGSNLVASDYRDAGVPVIFVRDILPDHFRWKSAVFLDQAKALSLSAHESRPNDILATKMGFPPCISCLHPNDFPPAVITADMIRLRISMKNIAVPTFVSFLVNTEIVQSQVRAITGGVTRPKVTLRDFRSLKIPYPKFSEQERIVEIINKANEKVDCERDYLNKLRAQKAGLMQDLLTGRVRVKSDKSAGEPSEAAA